jgi:hypothetical protein
VDRPNARPSADHLLGAATNALLRETDSVYRAITGEHYLQSRASLRNRMALCGFAAETHHATGTAANAATGPLRELKIFTFGAGSASSVLRRPRP